ncbi:serine protease snake-like [Hyposmocoma kahamanoa]|uniref:serine protease snake-like n=1 Tax=Hyposmocoma kahamanoa TaxID=1477025 RepID=UPI000E6D9DF5|nr:serine protease snake-like [Hyposmocoma kahamanoa]
MTILGVGPPITRPTTKYVPKVTDYIDNRGGENNECEPIPASLTAPKIGRKAFDKCKEYQEEHVYPCSENQAIFGGLSRTNECGHSSDDLIIGGENSTVREFPHMALLGFGDRDNLQWVCGGSVISENFILTAGHCTIDNQSRNVTHVLLGVLKRTEMHKAKIYRVKKIIKHPEYKPPVKYNDIALLELEVPLTLSKDVVPACLHIGDQVKDDRAIATGWGATAYRNRTSNAEVLQKVTLTKFGTEECLLKFRRHRHLPIGFNPNTQICYGDYTQSKDACQGDSGGPLQIKSKRLDCMYIIVGVTSIGGVCGTVGQPGIYTKVAPFTPWIESIVWP